MHRGVITPRLPPKDSGKPDAASPAEKHREKAGICAMGAAPPSQPTAGVKGAPTGSLEHCTLVCQNSQLHDS